MSAALLLPMMAKALTTAVVVILAAKAAQALGPRWGAIIASLPVSAGPAYVFLAMEHSAEFVAASALTSAAANAATGLFLLAHGLFARRGPFWLALTAALAIWLAASSAVLSTDWTVAAAGSLNLAVYGIAIVIASAPGPADVAPTPPTSRASSDLACRAVIIGIFVCLVVTVGRYAGPHATGIAAVFPLSLTSVLLLVQARAGGAASVAVAISALPPMFGFGVMLLLLHLAIPDLGMPGALAVALGFSLLWSAGLALLARRQPA